MSPLPFVPEYFLEVLRFERERQYALNAYIARYRRHPCRSLPPIVGKPLAALGRILLVAGHRLETAAGFQLDATVWPLKYEPCEGCSD